QYQPPEHHLHNGPPTSPTLTPPPSLHDALPLFVPAAGDPAHEVVAEPELDPVGVQLVGPHRQLDRRADVRDVRPRDARQPRRQDRAAEQAREQRRSDEDRTDPHRLARPRLLPVGPGELQVVDGAHGLAVGVEHLPAEQVQPGVDDPFARHEPAPVAIMSGTAASAAATTMTRYTVPSALTNRPLTYRPMYCGSLATTRIGT